MDTKSSKSIGYRNQTRGNEEVGMKHINNCIVDFKLSYGSKHLIFLVSSFFSTCLICAVAFSFDFLSIIPFCVVGRLRAESED